MSLVVQRLDMLAQRSPIERLIERTFGRILRFPDPGRFGWVAVLLLLVLAYWSVIRGASSREEAFAMLSLLSFTSSIAFAEPRIKWPTPFQKPLSLLMLVIGTGLFFFWFLAYGRGHSFNLMALLFALAVTLRETRSLLFA